MVQIYLELLVVEFKRLNQDALVDLFSLHSPGFPRPTITGLFSAEDVLKQREEKAIVARRYRLRHASLNLLVTDSSVRKELLDSHVLPRLERSGAELHALVTLVDCSELLKSYRPDEYIAHLRSYHHQFPDVAHVTIFIRAAPTSDERRTFLINLAGQDALYEDQFMFINSGDSGPWPEISTNDRNEFKRLLVYLNGRTPISVTRLMICPTLPLKPNTVTPQDVGEISFVNYLGGLASFIPLCIVGYVMKKMFLKP